MNVPPRSASLARAALAGLALVAVLTAPAAASAGTKLLRFPDIHGDRVVFSYAGDLWTASTEGGTATRITAHPGLELFPKFSPDGSTIAFTGQYDGDEQVYVVPATGGTPRQLTFYPARGPLPPRWGYDQQVYDWSADGKSILFRSLRYSTSLSDSRLFLVPAAGGLPEPLPMPESGAGDLSPDGSKVVYSPLFRDFRTWKRYEGGWAQELYVFDLSTYDLTRVTDHIRADRDPMWIGGTIYFASDRTGTMNLFAHDLDSGETTQLTDSDVWDVRWPSDDGTGRIVYEIDGELAIHDIAAGTSRSISIDVPHDGVARRPDRIAVARYIEDYALAPKGERVVFTARGDIHTAPIEHGATRNLTRSSSAHDKEAAWSPDGAKIVFLSDRTGEEELWWIDQAGAGEPEQLTDGGRAMRYDVTWSPTGDHIAFADKDGKLWVLDVESRDLTEVDDDPSSQLRDFVWSPDGRHIAYSKNDPSTLSSLYIWSVDGEARRVTGPHFHESSPSWDPNGDFLFYISDRDFAPQIGSREWNYVVDRESSIYAMALRDDVEHPLWPRSDEVALPKADDAEGDAEGDEEPAKSDKKKADKKKPEGDDADGEGAKDDGPDPIEIDFDGLEGRSVRLPIDADNYLGVAAAADGNLLYARGGPFYYGRGSDVQTELHVFNFKKRESEKLMSGIGGLAISYDYKKALVRGAGGFQLIDAKPGGGKSPKNVSTAGLVVDRVPQEEWAQIFEEVWRRYRDFFYAENMHGYDWEALRDRYRPWVEHIAHRSDLNYLIGEMIAELNVGHAYISGGDWSQPRRDPVALPGAEFGLDPGSNRYRITRVLRGDNRENRYRSPLTELGVDVAVGDYVLAIDGEELLGNDNPYRLLRHRSGHPVTLRVSDRPTDEGARDVSFRPVTSETDLRYHNWVEANRRRVEAMSDGRLGYLHIPDMGAGGIREFIKWFYPQIRKEGLVIDVRGNGGGNVSPMIIERLGRKLLGTRFSRNSELAGTYPAVVFHGHLVCLLDEDSASDGDIFPYRFREAGLGPLIGKRSWGGVVGITNRGTLIDGGTVNVPEFGTNDVDGSYAVEGYGVAPDIEVENDPKSLLEGRDPQLERGIEELLRKIEEDPKTLPERPADPVKTS